MSAARRRQTAPAPKLYGWRCKRPGCNVAGEEPSPAESLAKWTAHDMTEHYRPDGGAAR